METMMSEDEQNVLQQARKNIAEIPHYRVTEEELQVAIAVFLRDFKEKACAMQPENSPRGNITHTFDAQSKYFQKMILRHEKAFAEALKEGNCAEADWNAVLDSCGLGEKNRLDPLLVRECLTELSEERFNYFMEFEIAQRSPEFSAVFDFNALTVRRQAEELGLVMVEPDRRRGVYAGPMVGEDHRAGLVKYAREKAVELPFSDLAVGQNRPDIGNTVRMVFREGVLMVTVMPHPPLRP